jgi:D-alanine-D-alanine ligase
MKIGLTYDLRSEYLAQGYGEEETAESDRDDTIDALEEAIKSLGYETKEKCETEIIYKTANDDLVNEAEKLALKAYKALNCRDVGRIDIRASSSGTPEFIEINPIPGLHPYHSDLPMIATRQGISYSELINQIIQATISRYHKLLCRKVV